SLEIIDQEAKRLTALVENVLHLARAERGVARVAPTETLIAPSIRETVSTFAQLPRSRNVEFRLELEDRLVASVDPGALHQIILNLLDNAVKYGPAGQRVGVGLAMFEQHARLWVDDEGPGIPARERERVFEPFYRAGYQTDSKVVGSGIGLAVVRELTALLRGRVWADDAPGGGARIVVEFPDAYLRAEEATGGWAVA
ncbi:MAG TPA: HAMP domain-containing sensor histidine kinase, partial [Longimicrobiales bacterium]|nr:HAMP domain-containing sensor histidine kinase [Longimicrobiales bacterium]